MEQIQKMNKLITTLKAIEECDEIEYNDILNWGLLTERHQLIQTAVELADEILVSETGQRDFENEQLLLDDGYFVTCLERDRFGWVAGGVETTKGVIAYG
jgi:hypothetical protein